jgi:hypothetical protein
VLTGIRRSSQFSDEYPVHGVATPVYRIFVSRRDATVIAAAQRSNKPFPLLSRRGEVDDPDLFCRRLSDLYSLLTQ